MFQNEDVTALKIKYNPFAKAFLDKPNNNSGSPESRSPQQQLQHQDFHILDQVASALHHSHSQHQFQQQQQQQQQQQLHQHRFRHTPYNIQQRLHQGHGSGSPPNVAHLMKDEPDLLYTPNYWSHSSALASSGPFLESSAFDSMCNGWNAAAPGSFYSPPVTSSPPGIHIAYSIGLKASVT